MSEQAGVSGAGRGDGRGCTWPDGGTGGPEQQAAIPFYPQAINAHYRKLGSCTQHVP